MPELPEVETIVRGLRGILPGRRIVELRAGKIQVVRDPAALGERVAGSRFRSIRRVGKFLHLELEPLAPEHEALHLVIHLGMTGQLRVVDANEAIEPHTHVFFMLDDGRELRFRDPRRFGRVLLATGTAMEGMFKNLGADPLNAGEDEFRAQIGGRRARIKALLLDQHVFRGMGNIYADESLWRAKIHPARLAANLKADEVKRLHAAVRGILEEAIALKGSSVSDYVGADGQRGEFQMRHRVYQREGEKCFRCRTEIRRVIIAGRSSHFCPTCQPVPRSKTRNRKSKKPAKRPRQRLRSKTQAASRSLSRAKNQKRAR
jgi:formamidopyrimidine-DNA glycosylase